MTTIRRDRPVTHAVEIPPVLSVAELAVCCGFARCEPVFKQFHQHREPAECSGSKKEFMLVPFAGGTGIMRANAEFFDRGLLRPTIREFLSFLLHYREVFAKNNIRVVFNNAEFSNGTWRYYLAAPTGDRLGLDLLAVVERDVIADNYDFAGIYVA